MKKLVAIVLALMVLMVTTSVYAFPADTILIGNKAFSIFHLSDTNYESVINEAIMSVSVEDLYYKLGDDFISVDGDQKMTDAKKSTITNVEFVDSNGKKWTYKTLDDTDPTDEGTVTPDEKLKIIDIY